MDNKVLGNDTCPCGSKLKYAECCEPYITGVKNPPTAEALMRSRYTAYTVHAIDYIINTCVEDSKKEGRIDYNSTKDWSENSKWLGLKIISVDQGSPTDSKGTVEFEANYEKDGLKEIHHETANFVKKEEKWLYKDGHIVPKTVVRSGPKIGRNEPCPCGSGRKYKQCCGRS